MTTPPQNPYGQDPWRQADNGPPQPPYSPPPYSPPPYGQAPYGQAPYGQPGQAPSGQPGPPAQPPYGQPGPPAQPPYGPPAWGAPTPPPRRNNPLIIIGALVAVLLVAGGLVFASTRGSDGSSTTAASTTRPASSSSSGAGSSTGAAGSLSVDASVGDCVHVTGSTSSPNVTKVACGSTDSNYKVTSTAATSDACTGDSDYVYYETSRLSSTQYGALCMDVDWSEGQCFDVAAANPVRVACTASGADVERVGKTLQGTSDNSGCPDGGVSYKDRKFVVCLEKVTTS